LSSGSVILGVALVAACGDGKPTAIAPARQVQQDGGSNGAGRTVGNSAVVAVRDHAKALGLSSWHDDFPFPVHLSPRVPGRWYDRSKRQALAQIVANLQGNCTKPAWEFARMFFAAAPEGAAELLADAADKHFTAPGMAAFLENLADAMARTGDPAAAPALLRLMQHPNVAVGTRAVGALVGCGTRETLAAAEKELPRLNLRAYTDWLRAVARRTPDDVEAVFVRYLEAPRMLPVVTKTILEEASTLPPAAAVRIVERLTDPRAHTPDTTIAAAAIMHRAGDKRGTARLREAMRGDNPLLKATSLRALIGRDLAPLLDDVLRLSLDPDAEVRTAVAEVLSTAQGDPVDETLTNLGADVATSVRQVALRALAARGKRYHLDQLIERVRAGSGTNLATALQDISASADPLALAVIYERYQKVPTDEKRRYMQALAYSRSPVVFPYLAEIFAGPEAVIGDSGLTTVGSAALLLANIDGAMDKVIALAQQLPRADYRRRGHLVRTVANFAGVQDDAAAAPPALAFFRALWTDQANEPQVRLYALQQHRRYLSLADAMAIKGMLESEAEPMRWALSDFLFEFF
jgi:HEAT repeat protein